MYLNMLPPGIHQKLQQYIDSGDEKLLKLMYALAKEYTGENDYEYEFTDNEIKIWEERRKRLKMESKTYSWADAKDRITGKRKSDDI
jgi:hypothetical protein